MILAFTFRISDTISHPSRETGFCVAGATKEIGKFRDVKLIETDT